jgi:hypothetical protein
VVTVEKVVYLDQPNCYTLTNGTVEVIVTTDIGPRVIRYGFVDADNILAEVPDLVTKTDLGDWKPWGGHRLWAAPETMPGSYAPDNSPLDYHIEGNYAIRLMQPTDASGLQKEITVTLTPQGTCVTLHHTITNRNCWRIAVAPWTVTIMNGGGLTVLPQEPYRSHDDYLLPARPLVLWYFTDLSDPRWTIGPRYICLKTDERMAAPQKIGIANKQGWCAYHRHQTLFVKRFGYQEGASYPDYGSNNETYTTGSYMEVESLGPMQQLEPGDAAEHIEHWYLFRDVDLGTTEASMDAALTPLVAQTE